MSGILALVDGSTYSESVCDHAAWVATRKGVAVDLLHVLAREDAAQTDLSGNIGLGARTKLMEQLAELDAQKAKLSKQRGRAILEDAEARLRADGVEDITTRLRHGDLIEELQTAEAGADLVVVGKRGESADFDTLRLGSHVEPVVRASRIPVLVTSRAFKPITSLLIAFDGGQSARKAVDHIAGSKVFAGLKVTLLTAGIDSEENRRALETAKAQLDTAGYDAETRVTPGRADSVITEAVADGGFDMVVMGAFGHSRIRSLFIGSTTAEMVRSCQVPLLLFR